jgi:hypothetical protein
MVQRVYGKRVTKNGTKLELEDIKQELYGLNNRKKRLEHRIDVIDMLQDLTFDMRRKHNH